MLIPIFSTSRSSSRAVTTCQIGPEAFPQLRHLPPRGASGRHPAGDQTDALCLGWRMTDPPAFEGKKSPVLRVE
jgi:hypothetical protein